MTADRKGPSTVPLWNTACDIFFLFAFVRILLLPMAASTSLGDMGWGHSPYVCITWAHHPHMTATHHITVCHDHTAHAHQL